LAKIASELLKFVKEKAILTYKNAAHEVVHAMLLLSKLKISLLFLVLLTD
jgi:hypothetical protein